MYAVLSLVKRADLSVFCNTISIPLSFYDGMIGIIPVFETRKQAEIYADNHAIGSSICEVHLLGEIDD